MNSQLVKKILLKPIIEAPFDAKSVTSMLVLATLILSPGISANDAFPVTVTDDRGKPVTVSTSPSSVASVSAFGADTLKALGQNATGISTLQHRKSVFLGEQVHTAVDLGEVHEPDMERLTQLKPDLIVGLQQYAEPFSGQFEKIAPLLTFDLVTLEDSNRSISALADAVGKHKQGIDINDEFDRKLNEYRAQAPGGVSVVFLWHWADTIYVFYDHHIATHIMTSLKAEYSMGPSPTPELKKPDATVLSMEQLLTLNPDVIISFTGDDKPVSFHPVWKRLKAVKTSRAYRVSDQYVMTHGPIARDMVLRELAHLFYPETFREPIDIPAEARAKPLVISEG
ncbi:Putative ABC transporter substrate-binding lipoprotein YhfQ precursor [Grimontia marina]|uniref:Putative ABC transporter substrate-binding lipoprotein YhfQ n=2 Tax=Grimontia marina TaxID=646534 RepID=A0A128F7Z3_9GAMM|nr:Putative ABC transporter substrate-binding lipoprotein YhfQ precursor [Grimontia marina]